MTYNKTSRHEMGHDWVSEVTEWYGGNRTINLLVERPEDIQ